MTPGPPKASLDTRAASGTSEQATRSAESSVQPPALQDPAPSKLALSKVAPGRSSSQQPHVSAKPKGDSAALQDPAPTARPKPTGATGRAKEVSKPTVGAPAQPSAPNGNAKPRPETGRSSSQARATLSATPILRPPAPEQLLQTISTLGRLLDDLEHVRVQNSNRIAALEREYGSALPGLIAVGQQVKVAEHLAELELIRAWRQHPLHTTAKAIVGLGEKSAARLIAETGDPATRPNPAKLWAYCGIGDPERKRRKGMTQEEAFKLGNPRAKKQTWLIAEALVKRQCPACKQESIDAKAEERARQWQPAGCTCLDLGYVYRHFFNGVRAGYSDRVHKEACVRCGPAGKPAAPGSPWSDKHKWESAKRVTVKRLLLDLWTASRPGHDDAQRPIAGGDNT